MKDFSRFQAIAFLALGMSSFCARSGAQGTIGLGVTDSPDPVFVNGTLTYTISVTNLLGDFANILVTNTWSASVSFLSANRAVSFTNDNVITFNLGTLASGEIALIILTAQPNAAGFITNVVTAFDATFGAFANASAGTQVSSAPPTQTDLAVSVTGPAFPVLINDLVTYGVTVNNLGPASASGVMLSNSFLPVMVKPIDLSPTNQFTNSTVVFSLGTLTNLSVRRFSLTIQPTNAGVLLPFSASVSSTNITDANSTNNIATTNVMVSDFVEGQLIATNISEMTFNPQTALMEQRIRLVNVSTSSVPSARVIVTGLTNWLYNAVGTNAPGTNRNPFVIHAAALAPNQSVDLLLEFFVPNRLPIDVTNSNYIAVGTAPVNLSAPPFSTLNITNIVVRTDGSVLIEFPAVPGKTYTIQYSSDLNFATDALLAQPSIVAQADKAQWIDDGPPKTVSHPGTVPSRFYRVVVNNP
jgi:uncharacterized repeat protein (TIGR01451 family)